MKLSRTSPRVRIPLHIAVEDISEEADINRLHLHNIMAQLSGGNGFRYPSSKTNRGRAATRQERIGKRLMGGGTS